MCDKGFIWNPSNCECECARSCGIGEYLEYKSCKCRNKIIDKLIEKCTENIDGNEMFYNQTLDAISLNATSLDAKARISCTTYIVLCAIFFITRRCTSSVFIHFYWHLKKNNVCVKFHPSTTSLSKKQFIEYNSIECNPNKYI